MPEGGEIHANVNDSFKFNKFINLYRSLRLHSL